MAAKQIKATNQIITDDQITKVEVTTSWEDRGFNRYNIPAVCTCCLKPTENKAPARWSRSRKYSTGTHRVTETSTASLDFCVCPDCVAHDEEYRRNRSLIIKLSAILSGLIASMLNLRFASVLDPLAEFCLPLTVFIGFILVPLIVVLPIVFLLDLLYPVKPLDSQHSSRTKGVRLRGPRDYEFDNPAYAQLFALKNGEQAKFLLSTTMNKLFNSPYRLELKIRKTPLSYKIRGKSLLKGKPLVEIMGLSAIFSIVLMIVFSIVVTLFFEPPTAGNLGTYIFGGFGLLMSLIVCFVIVDHTGTLS